MVLKKLLARLSKPRWKRIAEKREKVLNTLIDTIISGDNLFEGSIYPIGDLRALPTPSEKNPKIH